MRHKSILLLSIAILVAGNVIVSGEETATLGRDGLPGLSACYTTETLGKYRMAFSFLGSFAYDEDMVIRFEKKAGSKNDANRPYAVLYDLYPSVAFGITSFLDISVMQPFYFDVIEGGLPAGGAGDLGVTLKGRIPGEKPRLFDFGLATAITIPYSYEKTGYFLRHAYYIKDSDRNQISGNAVEPYACYTSGAPGLSFTGIVSMNQKWFQLHVNGGVLVNFNNGLDDALLAAVGLMVKPNDNISLSSDLSFEPRFEALRNNIPLWNEPLHLSVSMTVNTPAGAILTLGSSVNLSSRMVSSYLYNTEEMFILGRLEPMLKTFLQFSWRNGSNTNDRDRDQLPDKDDQCPDVAEDIDSFQDTDGCPDFDNDNDNIPDTHDSCMNDAEDMDGFQDTDGCPDPDNDHDNYIDSVDACPNQAEDMDRFEDEDGCPDFDNDKDGVPDSTDLCPIISEDLDNFEDLDGCPDYDNDKDAIPDSIDKCPDSIGIAANSGCSEFYGKAKEISFGRLILPGVTFDDSTNELISESFTELDRLYASLAEWPAVVVEIQCHTDNVRSPELSLACSMRRAEAVLDYLVKKGVNASRLKIVGKGSNSPIADNAVVKGRLLNNRVEIHRKK